MPEPSDGFIETLIGLSTIASGAGEDTLLRLCELRLSFMADMGTNKDWALDLSLPDSLGEDDGTGIAKPDIDGCGIVLDRIIGGSPSDSNSGCCC